jgi:hypothetical protein
MVMGVYNSGRYLREAVESIPNRPSVSAKL